jgi:photosystem II PsbK protein
MHNLLLLPVTDTLDLHGLVLGRLAEQYAMFYPLIDILPILPFFFFLFAFVWQASVGFR